MSGTVTLPWFDGLLSLFPPDSRVPFLLSVWLPPAEAAAFPPGQTAWLP